MFSPVVWEPLEERLRAAALAERKRLDGLIDAGLPLERPKVVLIDDIPVYGSKRKTPSGATKRDIRCFVLVLAEYLWQDTDDEYDPFVVTTPAGRLRLRLVRATPKSNHLAWRLLFDELGYAPDFVVADAGTGIKKAVEDHFDPARTRFVPSLWHVGTAIRTGLVDTPRAFVAGPGGRHGGLRQSVPDSGRAARTPNGNQPSERRLASTRGA